MTQVPDGFRPAGRLRIRQEANEDEIGKALPDPVIRRLDASVHLLGPTGRAGSIPAADLQAMHQVIYQILRDTGRRPGEVVSLHTGCVEVTGGQHSLIYDNHTAGRMRRRLPITTGTAQAIMDWEQRRASLPTPPAQRHWPFPSPLLRAQRSHGAPDPRGGGPGVQGMGRPDRADRRRAARTGRAAGPVRPVLDHALRVSPLLCPAPR
jgi:integrase